VDVSNPASDAPPADARQTARRQIRGSSLLFAGQLLAKLVNFGTHVLIVRYLTQSDYGAFAYALAMVALGESLADFGLHRAITRYVPIYDEQRDYAKAFGTILLAVAAVLGIGTMLALGVYLGQGLIATHLIGDRHAVELLLILVLLSPVEALDRLLVGLFAVFAGPRAIFFRRYVVGPGLKTAVVLLLVVGQAGVKFLAAGYLIASTLGVVIYTVVLLRALRRRGLLTEFRARPLEVPWREVLAFTVPLLSTDLVHVLMHTVDAVLLGYFGGTGDVAAFRAVQPTARLNQLVFATFAVLFTPQAARLFARNDRAGINDLYWQTAVWIAILSFPIFVLTFSLAGPLTLLLFGARYEGSAPILAILALGYYVHAALGFNGTVLTIYRKLRFVVGLNLIVAVASIAANLVLIPRYGALGAAIATSGTLILHNVLKQAGLLLGTGINVFEWRYLRIYLIIGAGAGGLLAGHLLADVPITVSLALAAAVFLVAIRLNRELLDVRETFPELLRVPFMPWLLGRARGEAHA
jgi:O-antigen/teichoic acid export membrane protein